MKFKYTALNPQNHQMSGVLEAPSIEEAKKELHKMNLSILVITNIGENEYSEEKSKEEVKQEESGISTYVFRAINPEGKEIDGTIEAKDPYSAYKRLITNYHFQVNLIYKSGDHPQDPELMSREFKKTSELWNAQMKEEGIDVGRIFLEMKKSKDILEESEKIDQKMVEEVDRFIANIKSILTDQSHQFSPPFMGQVQKALDKLERIRTSNNIQNVANVCNEIYSLVSHPDLLSNSKKAEQAQYKRALGSVVKDNTLVKAQFELESKSRGLARLKGRFSGILNKISSAPPTPQNSTESLANGKPSLKAVLSKTLAYLKTSNSLLRRSRKREMQEAFDAWYAPVRQAAEAKKREKEAFRAARSANQEKKGEASSEANSFFGWLLVFYITYFFAAGLSLEKNIGIPQGFALKTLQSPLLLNITLFLLMAHLSFKVQGELFHGQRAGSFFVLTFSLVAYLLIVTNF